MSSEGTTAFHSNADVATTVATIQRVLADNKAKVLGQSPDGTQIDFQTRKTMLNWELLGRAVTTPAASGSDVSIYSTCTTTARPP